MHNAMLIGLKTSCFITVTAFPTRPHRFPGSSPTASRHGGQILVPVQSMRVVIGGKN